MILFYVGFSFHMVVSSFIQIYINLTILCFFLRYFFPTYENDNLLCALEDEETEEDGSVMEASVVIAEDLPMEDAINRRQAIMEQLQN